ncbi:dihydrofolate reductase family protein [Asanoa sp. WMMD1127]|uniref:dihydrofolate reductase family protein n=1 Tax=Asanoa sp. WMMD1127 TaxID=3016107 RepID=UPI002416303D|nr:dihydrofolate reductase family protein [Asanoa sp. WMMD1127]MDG4824895.1 dihydrofolate reductase family protein [Asanoa sp. WMMD1127]
MGNVVVVENVTLDGVMQAPAAADEDQRGGFAYGGWAVPYMDQVMAETMGTGMRAEGAMLFGRRTYEHLRGAWADRTDGNPYTEVLNRRRKYVASRTLRDPLPWQNSTLLDGDAVAAVAALKREFDGNLAVLGSGELVRALLRADLVDVLTLSIHPLTLGTGTRLLDGVWTTLDLTDTVPTTTGVIIATYRRRRA